MAMTDQAPTRAERVTLFNTAMKAEKAQLGELRAVDPAAYERLKAKAAADD